MFFFFFVCSSFFQSVCVLGYCLTPVAISLIVCRIILLATQSPLLFFLRLLTTTLGFLWATYGKNFSKFTRTTTYIKRFVISASFIFLGDSQPPNRKPLAVYPIFLFFFIISWLVISHN